MGEQIMEEQIMSGIFLLLILILSNYLNSTIGRRIDKLINNSYTIKLILLYIIIYFGIHYTTKGYKHITIHLKNTTIIFILYILLTKIDLYISLFSMLLIIINFTTDKYIKYLEENNINSEKYKYYNDKINKSIYIVIIIAFIYKIHNKENKLKYIFSDN